MRLRYRYLTRVQRQLNTTVVLTDMDVGNAGVVGNNHRLDGGHHFLVACGLQSLGMARGNRIGMLALNSDRYLEFFQGTWWSGGAVNPVNIRWSAGEIAYSLDD